MLAFVIALVSVLTVDFILVHAIITPFGGRFGSPDQIRTGVSGLKGRTGWLSQQAVYLGKRCLTW